MPHGLVAALIFRQPVPVAKPLAAPDDDDPFGFDATSSTAAISASRAGVQAMSPPRDVRPVPIDNAYFLQQLIGPLGGDDDNSNAWVCSFNEPPTPRSPWTGHLVTTAAANVLNHAFNTYYSTSIFPLRRLAVAHWKNAISPFVVVID